MVFAGCSSLKSITIPNSVTSIGKYAFYLCSSLKSVYITNIEAWLSIDFGEYSSNPLCNGANLYLNNELVTDLVIPEGITSIGNSAFSGCSSLESITIPEEITSIGDFAFEGCSKLNYIYYKGTADEWDNIDGSSNVYYGTIYYYSETEPITSGNYWHYDEDGITPVIWNKN